MKSRSRHILFLLAAMISVAFFTLVTYKGSEKFHQSSNRVTHAHQLINAIHFLYMTVTDSQAKDNQLSAPQLNRQTAALRQQLAAIRQLTTHDASHQQNITTLIALSERWINSQQNRQSNLLTDTIRQYLAAMSVKEEQLLQQRMLENKLQADNNVKITVISGVLYILVAFLIVFRMKWNAAQRKTTNLSLLNSEVKYRRLIENTGVVMVTTNPAGEISFVNNRIESLTGYKNTELVNKPITFLVAPAYINHVKNHYQNQFEKRLPEAWTEFPVITKTGEEKWVEQDSVLLFEDNQPIGFQSVIKDIQHRKNSEAAETKIEEERKEYEYRLQSILDNTPLMIFIKDLEGKYILVNKRLKETLKHQTSLIGKTDYEIDTPENAHRFRQTDQQVMQTLLPLELEETIEDGGKIQNVMVVKFPLIDQAGKVFAVSGIATDITERVLYHKHLLETRKNAETAEKRQGEFLANMSHEIRTPMTGILGMTNLLLQTALTNEQESFLHIIRQSSDNLLFLINDILDLSKIKAAKMTIESIPFNIANVMETVIAPFRIKLKEKGVELITGIHSNIPDMVIGDPYRLSQVLSNLFNNALKFTREGHIRFSVSLSPGDDNCALQFSVEDTGIGIPAEQLDQIFESFVQASTETTRKFGGTGLGLSITKQLIELQNGKINVESTEGVGTTFRFIIPFKGVAQGIASIENEKPVFDKQALRGKHILIVEDNEVNQMVISFTLKQAGVLTTIVNNGREAIDLLETSPALNVDLIIMDLQMPLMNGFDTSLYIREQLHLQVPILAMTASILQEERIKCLESGMNDYLSKPFKPAVLFVTINRLLNETPQKKSNETVPVQAGLTETAFHFENLYKIMPKMQVRELLVLFIDNTPVLLTRIQMAVLSGSLKEVTTLAQTLKSSVELLQLQEMMQDANDLERMARLNVQPEMMPLKLNRLIDYFNAIKPMLEKEIVREVTA